MNYAFNGCRQPKTQMVRTNGSPVQIKKYIIKQSRQINVEGTSSLRTLNQGVTITMKEYNAPNHKKLSQLEKYAKISESIIYNKVPLSSDKESLTRKIYQTLSSTNLHSFHEKLNQPINFVIVCCSITEKLSKQQIFGIKCLIGECEEKGIGSVVVGTKIDCLCEEEQLQQEKVMYIEAWKDFLSKQIIGTKLQQRNSIYCIESYKEWESNEPNQTINYYSLKLLQRMIKQITQGSSPRKPIKKPSKLFCFCN